jgi:Trk-type K+ transport system membrane component
LKPLHEPTVVTERQISDNHIVRPAMMVSLGGVAVISLVLQHGFLLSDGFGRWFDWADVLLAVAFAAGLLTRIATARDLRASLQRRRFELLILGAFLLAVAAAALLPTHLLSAVSTLLHLSHRQELLLALVKLFLLANVGIQALRSLQRIFVSGARLELVLAGSFAALMLIGTLLLLLPRAAGNPAAPISLMDAFFTATSAVCVTGLVVRDTGSDFSTLGQMVILVLFQIGGLGIVTFVAFISAFSSKTLPVPQMVAFRQIINAPAVGDLKRRLAGILLLTALIEGAGVAALYMSFVSEADTLERLKWSVFHSVSAFCNAGFGLRADNLEMARSHFGINLIVMLLIVLGGLGFLVLPELIAQAAAAMRRFRGWLQPRRTRASSPPPPRLTVQTRLSLQVTGWLILAGFVGFWLLERGNLLKDAGFGESALVSLFQSVATRTAGFNTVPIGDLSQATLLLIIMQMVSWRSPLSTAAGSRVPSLRVLLPALRSMNFLPGSVEAHGPHLPARAYFTRADVFVLYAATAITGVFLIAIFDPQSAPRYLLHETISALSTVGLSTGITADLSAPARCALRRDVSSGASVRFLWSSPSFRPEAEWITSIPLKTCRRLSSPLFAPKIPHLLMNYAVVGLGKFGRSAALVSPQRRGSIAVDIDMERLDRVKDEVALAVRLDASHEHALAPTASGVDVLIAAFGDNFEAQVLVVVHAKQQKIGKITLAQHARSHRV